MNIATTLGDFHKILDQILINVHRTENLEEYESALAEGATQLAESIQQVGQESANYLSTLPSTADSPTKMPASILSYLWVEEAKSYLILWRDILLQQQKAKIMRLDQQVNQQALLQLRDRSKAILKEAGEELQQFYGREQARLASTAIGSKQLKQWSFQSNPWSIYKEQIQELAVQCREAEVQQNGLQNTTKGFQTIRQLIKDTISDCQGELQEMKLLSAETLSFVEEQIENKPGMVASKLEEIENQIDIPNHLKSFSASLKEKIDDLAAKMRVPIDTNGGMVQFKDANFKKNAQSWLDSEVVPVLYEVWEQVQVAEQNMKVSLLNIRNRAVLLSNETKEEAKNPIEIEKGYYGQPLEAIIKKLENWTSEITQLEHIIEDRLDENFKVAAIYDAEHPFLPVSLQSTLSQFSISQNKLVKQARNQLNRPTSFIRRLRETVNEEDALSPSEKIVRTLQDRNVAPDNNQYTSIFQTKGYIGESFWVGREQELQRMYALIEQWKIGFRGAAIVTGERLSGKSLFGDIVANKHFPKKTIRLHPHSSLNTEGRKWTTSYNLKEALDFIKKNTLGSKSLIWIDDLELWQDATITLGENIRSLVEHIDSNATHFFYMISMGQWLFSHLEKTHTIGRSFQAVITLDKMSLQEIQRAILIRHGATHKILVNKEKKEIPTESFGRVSAAVCRSTQRNIGDSLNRWAGSIQKVNEEQVIYNSLQDFPLPSDFLSPNAALLLATIFKEKRTNEYRLRRLFGMPFKEKYSSILQRLLSMGILKRGLDGMLEINELIANDLGRLLVRKKYL